MVFDEKVAKNGRLYAYDYTSLRLNTYNVEDYSFESSSLRERWKVVNKEVQNGFSFASIQTRNDGNQLLKFMKIDSGRDRPIEKYLLTDSDGNSLDFNTLTFPSSLNVRKPNSLVPSSLLSLPFMGRTIVALSNDSELYSVWTQDFLIKRHDKHGAYKSAIYYPIKGLPLSLNDYTNTNGYTRRDVENTLEIVDEELPETVPIIADLKVDDENRIWVAVPTGAQRESYEWWILKESGELLAKLVPPQDQPIYDIKKGYLYSKKTNEETGTEYVIKYRIELTEK